MYGCSYQFESKFYGSIKAMGAQPYPITNLRRTAIAIQSTTAKQNKTFIHHVNGIYYIFFKLLSKIANTTQKLNCCSARLRGRSLCWTPTTDFNLAIILHFLECHMDDLMIGKMEKSKIIQYSLCNADGRQTFFLARN